MSNETKAVVSAPLNPLVGQIIFCYGSHKSVTFEDKQSAVNFMDALWDEEDHKRLINLEMIIVRHRGYEPLTIHRGRGSSSAFVRKFENVMENLPCPGCDYVTCDCGLGLSLPNPSDQGAGLPGSAALRS